MSVNRLFPSQTFKHIKGQQYFESEGGIKNNSFINNNDYYPGQHREMKKNEEEKTGNNLFVPFLSYLINIYKYS